MPTKAAEAIIHTLMSRGTTAVRSRDPKQSPTVENDNLIRRTPQDDARQHFSEFVRIEED
jgi:hypothetical protein